MDGRVGELGSWGCGTGVRTPVSMPATLSAPKSADAFIAFGRYTVHPSQAERVHGPRSKPSHNSTPRAFCRRFFSPLSQRWQKEHMAPFMQPFAYLVAMKVRS